MEDVEEIDATAPWWVWTMLWACAFAAFWCQAVVTEER